MNIKNESKTAQTHIHVLIMGVNNYIDKSVNNYINKKIIEIIAQFHFRVNDRSIGNSMKTRKIRKRKSYLMTRQTRHSFMSQNMERSFKHLII